MPSTVVQSQRRRERFESAGLCHLCGKEPCFKGNKAGRQCLLKRNEHKQIVRQVALDQGLCQECRTRPAEKDSKHCSNCLMKSRQRANNEQHSVCVKCSKLTGLKRAKFCDNCRPAPNEGSRKYKADARIKELIREAYAKGTAARVAGNGGKSYVTCLAKQIGWPYWAVQKEAQRLGIVRIKEPDWSPEELKILERNAHWSPSTIRKRLIDKGYVRSLTAIELKRRRLNLFASKDYISPFDLAKNCFGVSVDVVKRWIKRGWLRAMERKDIDREDTCHWIKIEWVRDFVLKHPLEFDIRKVDQLWFIDLLSKGSVGVNLAEIREAETPSLAEMERNEFGSE